MINVKFLIISSLAYAHARQRRRTQNASDQRVDRLWPADRWCCYCPMAPSTKPLCPC